MALGRISKANRFLFDVEEGHGKIKREKRHEIRDTRKRNSKTST